MAGDPPSAHDVSKASGAPTGNAGAAASAMTGGLLRVVVVSEEQATRSAAVMVVKRRQGDRFIEGTSDRIKEEG